MTAVGPDERGSAVGDLFEIRVRGRVSDAVLAAFPEMAAAVQPVETLLYGTVADQAALHGLIDRVQALGLELTEVRRLPGPDEPPVQDTADDVLDRPAD